MLVLVSVFIHTFYYLILLTGMFFPSWNASICLILVREHLFVSLIFLLLLIVLLASGKCCLSLISSTAYSSTTLPLSMFTSFGCLCSGECQRVPGEGGPHRLCAPGYSVSDRVCSSSKCFYSTPWLLKQYLSFPPTKGSCIATCLSILLEYCSFSWNVANTKEIILTHLHFFGFPDHRKPK